MKEEFVFRKAALQDADEIYSLMETVYGKLDDKSIFVCTSRKHVKSMLTRNGFGIVVLNESSEIVGCFLCAYPGNSEDNLGKDIMLPQKDLDSVAHAETAVVLPEYRGNALQAKMLRLAEKLIDKKKYHYLLATVSPDNPASFKTLETNGFKHVVTKEKYGGFFRRIYCKKI